jgi:hypothetical protein
VLPERTQNLMILAEVPLWARVLLRLAFAAAVTVCLVWTLLVVVVCWPFAVAWWLFGGERARR